MDVNSSSVMPFVANILSSLGITVAAEFEETVSTSTKREYSSITTMWFVQREEAHRSRQRNGARGQMVRVTFLVALTYFRGWQIDRKGRDLLVSLLVHQCKETIFSHAVAAKSLMPFTS